MKHKIYGIILTLKRWRIRIAVRCLTWDRLCVVLRDGSASSPSNGGSSQTVSSRWTIVYIAGTIGHFRIVILSYRLKIEQKQTNRQVAEARTFSIHKFICNRNIIRYKINRATGEYYAPGYLGAFIVKVLKPVRVLKILSEPGLNS